jgi:hypothetical protein
MKNAVKNGAPVTCNRQEAGWGSATECYNSATIKDRATFSSVLLRTLDNRPPNEDRIRGINQ